MYVHKCIYIYTPLRKVQLQLCCKKTCKKVDCMKFCEKKLLKYKMKITYFILKLLLKQLVLSEID